MVKSTIRCLLVCIFLFKCYLGLVSQVHFSSHGCNCQNESEISFHICWLRNRWEPICTTPICRKLSADTATINWNFLLRFFSQWKEDKAEETKEGSCFIYTQNLQKQALSTRIRAKWNASCNTWWKDHRSVKGLERSRWSVLPAPIELSWWCGTAFILRPFQEGEGWCPDTAKNLGTLPTLGTVILSV